MNDTLKIDFHWLSEHEENHFLYNEYELNRLLDTLNPQN